MSRVFALRFGKFRFFLSVTDRTPLPWGLFLWAHSVFVGSTTSTPLSLPSFISVHSHPSHTDTQSSLFITHPTLHHHHNLQLKNMESILDFDKELDLPFLDKIVTSFYHGSGPDVPSLCFLSLVSLIPHTRPILPFWVFCYILVHR